MAHNLNLKTQWLNDTTLKVSWTDVKIRERNAGNQMGLVVVSLGGFFVAAGMGISSGNLWGLLIWLGAIIGFLSWSASKVEEFNSLEIGSLLTRHNGHEFNTRDITRFEMGTEVALLGSSSTKPMVGQDTPNQTIIRMWVNDTSAYDLSKNNWQSQVNHEIHATLTKALEAVRDLDKQEEHAKEFGEVSNDTGMPDY